MTAHELDQQLHDLRFSHRLEQAELVASCPDAELRTKAAVRIVQEIAMQRVFDRFTRDEETRLLDILWPHAQPEGSAPPPVFGFGARDKIDR